MTDKNAKELMSKAEQELAVCQNDFHLDRPVNMARFEGTVADLCRAIEKLPQSEILQFEAPMKKMGETLQKLSEDLTKKRDELKGQMQGLSTHKLAQAAYKNADKNEK